MRVTEGVSRLRFRTRIPTGAVDLAESAESRDSPRAIMRDNVGNQASTRSARASFPKERTATIVKRRYEENYGRPRLLRRTLPGRATSIRGPSVNHKRR